MSWMNAVEAAGKLPKLIFQGKVDFDFDGIPLHALNLSLGRRLNLITAGADLVMNRNRQRALPPIIQVEPTNICNLKCPLCPTGSGTLKRQPEYLDYGLYRSLLDEIADSLLAMYFFCFGEPFLHRDLCRMIRDCTDRNIPTLTSTNGNLDTSGALARNIVRSGLKVLIIAVDGSTQDTYAAYRIEGDLDRVKDFIASIEEAKRETGSPHPYTVLRTVVMRSNVDDLRNLLHLAEDLQVNMFATKTVGCMVEGEEYRVRMPEVEGMRRFDYAQSGEIQGGVEMNCIYPFRQPVVFCDGTVVGCEYDHDLTMAYGRLGERSFREIWNSPKALELRRSIRSGHNLTGFCVQCPYRDNVRRGTALFTKELRPLHA